MTLSEQALARVLRRAVKSAIGEAVAQTRTTKQLSGTVEQLDEDLDVVWVRLDNETLSSDPTQSLNYEAPGIIPATRLGETFTDEQVRVTFDGPAGATAIRTSTESRIVLPFGVESGKRIEFDGELGFIAFYDDADALVGYLDAAQWFVGGDVGLQARLDPIGGLRLRDEAEQLRVQVSSSEGVQVREPTSGISGAILRHDGLLILDPETGERISITSGTSSAVPTPHWASSQSLSPGTTHSTPAISSFATGDDIDLRFSCASAAALLGAQSYTPPASYTEQTDQNDSSSGITLATSLATRDPAIAAPGVANFTNTSAGFTRRNGHSVIVRGGGATSPAIAGVDANAVLTFTTQQLVFDIDAPVVTEGNLLVAHVALAGGQVPIGWTVPDGWIQLGIQVAGLGTSHILGSGVWYKRAGPAEPATQQIKINMTTAGLTKLQATVVSVSNPYGYPGGLDIRRNNRSMPRGQVAEVISETNSAAISSAAMPVSLETLTNVELLAGRKYRIAYTCPIYSFAALSAACIVAVRLRLDTGAGFVVWHQTHRQHPGGTERGEINLGRVYTPLTDEIVDVDLQIHNEVTGAGHTMQLFGSSNYRRSLTITDEGAAF